MGAIREIAMETRRERVLPFILITAIYVGVTYSFYSLNRVNSNDNFLKFLIIIDALVVVSTIATFFFKVSVHSVAAWGFIGILFSLNLVSDNGALYFPSLIAIVVAGIIMSARLYLNVHTLREVFAGAVLGLATSMVAMNILFQY
jgi:membrane-associated phospholipid phosphatase